MCKKVHISQYFYTIYCLESDTPLIIAESVVTSEPYIVLASPSVEATLAKATTTAATTTYTTPPPTGNGGGFIYGLEHAPCRLNCPFCAVEMTTTTQEQVAGVTIVAVVILLLVFWPLFWLPLCLPSCKTVKHYCTHCHRKVGQAEACS